jgi:hypothetical protein
MEAISNAGSCVGILTKEGIVLGAEKRITSKVSMNVIDGILLEYQYLKPLSMCAAVGYKSGGSS